MSVDGSLIGALEVIGKLDDIQKAYHHVSQEFLLLSNGWDEIWS